MDKLTTKEERDIIVQAGLEAIPYVGGSLSTLYFGRKQELRFKRIEEFYKKVAHDLNQISEKVSISGFDQQKLADLIETINDNVEKEIIDEKIDYFKNIFIRTIQEKEFNYDRRKMFVRCLGDLDEPEIYILKEFQKIPIGQTLTVKNEEISNDQRFETIASLEKLKSYGLTSSHLSATIRPNIDWSEITQYKLTEIGKEFIEFCLKGGLHAVT